MPRNKIHPDVRQAINGMHPKIRRAMEAIELPEVQEMLRRLAKHGLAIAVPHIHAEEGGFLPLPNDKIGVEDGLVVSFKNADDPNVETAIPVMWRASVDGESEPAAKCITFVCVLPCHKKKRG